MAWGRLRYRKAEPAGGKTRNCSTQIAQRVCRFRTYPTGKLDARARLSPAVQNN
jgi:hypothetical protein